MEVRVETQKYEKGQNVTGPIWIELAGQAFPSSHWDDFPVIILGWWLQELHNLSTGTVNRVECHYMDGPYHFEITSSKSLWMVKCLRREEVLVETKIENIQDFIRSFVESAKAVLNLCDDRGWRSADLEQLRTASLNFTPR